MIRYVLCVLAIGAAVAALPARADSVTTTRAWTNCEGGEGIWSELRISGCSEVLKSGKAEGGDLARAHYNRANAYLAKGEYDLAIVDYDRALETNREDANALSERCWARALIGAELDRALSDCNEALRLKPDDAETLGARAFTCMRLGLYRTAILDYDAALKIDRNSAVHLYARGMAKLKAGDLEEGNADLAAARTLDGKVETTYARYEEAGQSSMWVAMVDGWRAMMRWVY